MANLEVVHFHTCIYVHIPVSSIRNTDQTTLASVSPDPKLAETSITV